MQFKFFEDFEYFYFVTVKSFVNFIVYKSADTNSLIEQKLEEEKK